MAKIARTLYTVRSGDHAEVEHIAYDYHEVLSIEHGGVEFVPVVRCKDCAKWATEKLFTGGCCGAKWDADPNGYCAWPVRRTEEDA